MSIDVTTSQIHILRHSLGLSDPYAKSEYRNHFVASEGHHDWADLLALEAAGLMTRRKHALLRDDAFCWSVTEKGKEVARANAPKISRGKRMYRKYLEVADCCPDLTFREFLTSPQFAESRASA